MKKFTNQRGLAALELVLVAAIVAIFATAAVPRMESILDKVQLDYELKRLYSTFEFARSIGKNSDGSVKFIVSKKNDEHHIEIDSARHREYFLPKDFDLYYNGSNSDLQITFTNPSMYSEGSKTITLTSRLKSQAKIMANSVGRWRGTYE